MNAMEKLASEIERVTELRGQYVCKEPGRPKYKATKRKKP